MIIAVGKFMGVKTKIECIKEENEIIISVNPKNNKIIEIEFYKILSECRPIGGTYYPNKNSMLNAYNVLNDCLFDELVSIEVTEEFDETIPYEEGKIY